MRLYAKIVVVILFWALAPKVLYGQGNSDSLNYHQRKLMLGVGGGVLYVGSFSALYYTWYKDYNSTGFHFFNDNREWMGMDKVGHLCTAYIMSDLMYNTGQWAGKPKAKAAWIAFSTSMLYLSTIEMFDGFSDGWGFSIGDMVANTSGCLLFLSQQKYWNEQRIRMKFSYRNSTYAQHRPLLLGATQAERVLKDYNGQTYWLSANISSFTGNRKLLPAWLNIAAGYGASGMLGGHSNPTSIDGSPLPFFERKRHYYISLDADLSRIATRKKWLKTSLLILNAIKIPFPALEFAPGEKLRCHAVYF
jgi:uncharacterized protein YfiM (DUF2279 family)